MRIKFRMKYFVKTGVSMVVREIVLPHAKTEEEALVEAQQFWNMLKICEKNNIDSLKFISLETIPEILFWHPQ